MKATNVLSVASSCLLVLSFLGVVFPAQAQNRKLWALVICGSTHETFRNDASYMYHVLGIHYGSIFAVVRYLDVNLGRGADSLSTKGNVRSVITQWLSGQSTGNDIIFIYFTSHGGGYHTTEGLVDGRIDTVGGDEGNEQRESTFVVSFYPLNKRIDFDNDGNADDRLKDFEGNHIIELDINDDGKIDYEFSGLSDIDGDGKKDDIYADSDTDNLCDLVIDADTNNDGKIDNLVSDYEDANNDGKFVGIDLDQDGSQNDWVGIDECLQVEDGWYWDDELASDLGNLSYAKLIFIRQGCLEGRQGCFGGGLIDDISGSKRIVMSATNETCHSYGDMDSSGQPGYGYSEWSEAFMDALHGRRTHYDGAVIHDSIYVNADANNDGKVSMWEAWKYAWDNDTARLNGNETAWIDDNFNHLPTYKNEADQLDSTDGLFSMETYFGFENLKSPDANDDHVVDILDMTIISNAFNSKPGDPNWDPRADLNNDQKVNIVDVSICGKAYGKKYSDPPNPVSTQTILFTYPPWALVRKDEAFSMNVSLFNVTDLRGWEFKLYWNNTVLKCTGAEIHVPNVWCGNVFEAGPGIENDFNATDGRYCIAISALHPTPSFNGSMVLVTLTFEARASGTTLLDLQETVLASNEANTIPHIAIDGAVTVKKH